MKNIWKIVTIILGVLVVVTIVYIAMFAVKPI